MDRTVENIPPLLEAPRKKKRGPGIVFLAVIGAMAAARVLVEFQIPFLRCTFKNLTGAPCFTCGGTRSLAELSQFHFAEAFWLNPLVCLGAMAVTFWFLAWIVLPEARLARVNHLLRRAPWLLIGIVAAFLNWIFVLKFLPR